MKRRLPGFVVEIFFFLLCLQACRDFLSMAQTHSKRWQKALQAEREQRVRLEETLEQLAKQHNHLERAFRGAAQANASADSKSAFKPPLEIFFSFQKVHPVYVTKMSVLGISGPGKGEVSDDDDNEFFDAMEEAPEFITVPADPQFHKSVSTSCFMHSYIQSPAANSTRFLPCSNVHLSKNASFMNLLFQKVEQ